MDVHKLYQTLTGQPYPDDDQDADIGMTGTADNGLAERRSFLSPTLWTRLRRAMSQPGGSRPD
jgi:hypothetical protein